MLEPNRSLSGRYDLGGFVFSGGAFPVPPVVVLLFGGFIGAGIDPRPVNVGEVIDKPILEPAAAVAGQGQDHLVGPQKNACDGDPGYGGHYRAAAGARLVWNIRIRMF